MHIASGCGGSGDRQLFSTSMAMASADRRIFLPLDTEKFALEYFSAFML